MNGRKQNTALERSRVNRTCPGLQLPRPLPVDVAMDLACETAPWEGYKFCEIELRRDLVDGGQILCVPEKFKEVEIVAEWFLKTGRVWGAGRR